MSSKIKIPVWVLVATTFLVAAIPYIIGVHVGKMTCPKREPEVVERIVYKDTPETLEYVDLLESGLDMMSEAYIPIFEVAKIEMDQNGMQIYHVYYEIYDFAKEWLKL